MILGKIFNPADIKIDLESEDKDELFEEMVDLYVSNNSSKIDREQVLTAIRTREAQLSTGIGRGFAVPHARIKGLDYPAGIIGISKNGIDYDALDGVPVNIVFMLLSTPDDYALHLKILNRINILLSDKEFMNALFKQPSPSDVYNLICKHEEILLDSI